ncbi:hypothetical protein AQUCO_00500241v1 [Aquilegia coerulea]|uniref:Uncharacterized protein n=1 Tax=Aquilegia coerulea TaxID=218851 RepID=A0A2G5ER83_AQUCA|nr:hypothetical protein AQUCO_00500241v1 [Aquilegia coerulea]
MKRQRLSSMENLDRISSLHESIRRHVLSFLPMEDAIRTSVLSKNWRDVCSYLPNLEFNEGVYRQNKRGREGLDEFKDIIDQMLLVHDDSNIKRFMLRFYKAQTPISTQHLNAWISFVVRHNVQELTLNLDHWPIEQLPSCLFTCSTLTTLELNSLRLRLPTTIQFPLLKSLVLDKIGFVDDNSTNKLFSSSSCPVLEDLIILCCYQSIETTHTVSFSKLKLLKFFENDFFFNVGIDLNLKTNLFISYLHKFAYKGKEPPKLSCETLSSMTQAKFTLTLPPTDSNDTCENSASKILMGMRNVVTLSLKGFYIEFLTRDQDVSTSLVTSSDSLKTLKLHMHATKNQLQVVTFLLRSYRNVQSLSIYFSQITHP